MASKKYNITIVGAGNSGMAHAYVLSKLGHSVTILKTSNSMHDDNYVEIERTGGVWCVDETKGNVRDFAKIERITRDDYEAFANADIVLVLTQSLQHEQIAERISPHIQNIKALLVVPGNMGSMFFRQRLPKDVIIAEGESTIIDARISKAGEVHILFRNVRNALSFNPSTDTVRGFEFFHELLPESYTHTRKNIIETALNNPNLIVHTLGTIMSASRIEYSNGEFWMYREGFTPSIWNLLNSLDAEKIAVMNAYGAKGEPYIECCKFRNEADPDVDAMQAFRNYAENGSPKGPSSIHNRYLMEDVPNGLVLLSSLGEMAGIPTPTADALISLAGIMVEQDFRAQGRTPWAMGFKDKAALINGL